MNNNNFFLEVFNNLLKINDSEILIIFDVDGNIWFKYKELLEALGYNYADDALSNLKISISNKSNFQKNTIFINESGLYEVLSISTKPLAKIFMNKYFQEIMPKIRKTGQFILNKSDKQKLDKLNNTINNYKQEMTYYNDKYKFVSSENGHLYINEDNTIKNGKEIKCFKIGYATDMKKRLGEYKVGMLKDDN
jgi:prophage antirepressor-like protein